MGLVAVIVGLLLSAYGASLMLMSGGAVAGSADAYGLSRAKWRSRRGVAAIAVGVLLVILGALVLPLTGHAVMLGTSGVVLLILLQIVALVLDAIGIALVFLNGVALAAPEELSEPWLERAQRLTRYGIGALFAGLLAQLAGVAIIAR